MEKNFSNVLIQAIKAKGLTVEKLGQLTGISDRFLESFIEEKFDNLPAEPYVRGYVIKVAEVLGLDGEALWADYLSDNELIKRSGKGDELPKNRFVVPRANFKLVVLGLVIIVVLALVLLRLPLFSSGRALELISPVGSSVATSNRNFVLEGKIDRAFALSLNGERVYADDGGYFRETVELREGFNTFIFTFKKILGKEQTLTRQVFYQPATTTEVAQ